MSSKIERPAAEVLADIFREALHRGKQPTFSGGDLKYFIEQLTAPVVERQPNQCDGCRAGKPLVHGNLHVMIDANGYRDIMACTAHLYTAPPELAELQATIARLTAENERLKGGQGEPVAWKCTGDIGTPHVTDSEDCANAWYSHGGTVERLYTSQPAPVSVLNEVRALLATTNYSASRDCHNAQVVNAACDLIDRAKELNG